MSRNLQELDQALTDKIDKHESDMASIWRFVYWVAGYVVVYSIGLLAWISSTQVHVREEMRALIAENANLQLQQFVATNAGQDHRLDEITASARETDKLLIVIKERQDAVMRRLSKIDGQQ